MKLPLKIPITDRFLWMIYNFFEKTGKILDPPEIFKLRGIRHIIPRLPDEIEFWKILERKKRRRQFSQFINYLKEQGYIRVAQLKGKKGVLLTLKGQRKGLRAKFRLYSEFKTRKDKKWIMVIFDIPEVKRKYRDDFRDFLISLGFQNLQKSVWVCPYDVLKELEEIIRIYSLDKFIRIFIIQEIEIKPKN